MSTINANYMTKAYNNFTENHTPKNTSGQNMMDTISEKLEESKRTTGTCAASGSRIVSAKDMTMEEYKAYLSNQISQIPMHPTRMQESISITISDAGFEVMKNDPEYEAWVLKDLRTGWAQPDPWSGICGGAFTTIYYGATKEECHAEGWRAGYQNGNGEKLYNEKSGNSFWERKINRKKQLEQQYKKQQEELRLQKEAYERAIFKKYISNPEWRR